MKLSVLRTPSPNSTGFVLMLSANSRYGKVYVHIVFVRIRENETHLVIPATRGVLMATNHFRGEMGWRGRKAKWPLP